MFKNCKRILAAALAQAMVLGMITVLPAPTSAAFIASTAVVAQQAVTEGIVLLQNDDEVLPLGRDTTVSIFGRCQVDTFLCGYGSGVAPPNPYDASTIMDGIRDSGLISFNEELADLYVEWCDDNPVSSGSWGNWPYYYDEMPLTEELVAAAHEVSDVAIYVLGRAAGEDRECTLTQGSYYMTDEELEILDILNDEFDEIILMMNVGNIMDMAWIEDYDNIKSIINVWQGGLTMGDGVAEVLSGSTSPSGKLTATIANEYEMYPSSDSFGGRTYNEYEEDIFVGYRYFETFAQDDVMYPFGYGLSYTEFDIDASVSFEDGNVVVTADVTNVGDTYSGKEVVQVYFSAPQGELGKASRELAGYAKTNEIAPGATQTMTISFPIENMVAYDDSGATGNKSAWVMEAGDYEIYVGNSVRDASYEDTYVLDELVVVEQLEEASAPHEEFDIMVATTDDDGNLVISYEPVTLATEDADLATRVLENLPEAVEQVDTDDIMLIDVYNGVNTMDEFVAQLSDTEMESILRGNLSMDTRTWTDLLNASVFGGILNSLQDKGIPAVTTHDGPSGAKYGDTATNLPIGTMIACTWNDDLMESLYYGVGEEMGDSGADVLLAPGMNIQRSPLCGRNFEYFSEDPLLTGRMASSAVIGLQSAGASATPKHFAVNSQETNRNSNDSRLSERALREIYLRGFEICVKTAQPYALMASYNKINGEWAHYNYDLGTTILRDQWGFEGMLMTDWWLQSDTSEELSVKDNAYRVRAQVDINMPGESSYGSGTAGTTLMDSYYDWVEAGSPEGTIEYGLTLGELQRSASNVLNNIMESTSFRTANNLENTYEAGEPWFSVEGNYEEVVPYLETLTISGMDDFNAFYPSVLTYNVFYRDMDGDLPTVSATAEDGIEVSIVQATTELPTATVTTYLDGYKCTYRITFSDEAGMTPVVSDPDYAKVTAIQVDGGYLASFYSSNYEYSMMGYVTEADIVVESDANTECTITIDEANATAIIRAETDDHAQEYQIIFTDPSVEPPESDTFDGDDLNSDIWSVLNRTENLTVSDGSLNIQTEAGEWYGSNEDSSPMKNIVYQDMNGNWTATATMEFTVTDSMLSSTYNQFGIVVFQDSDNFADMHYLTTKWDSAGQKIQTRHEVAGSNTENINSTTYTNIPTSEGWTSMDSVTLEMRVQKEGNVYTFSMNTPGSDDFFPMGEVTAEYEDPKFGMYASLGTTAASSLVKFHDVTITDYEAASGSSSTTTYTTPISDEEETRVMAVDDAIYLSSNLRAETCTDETGGQDLGYGVSGDYAIYAIDVETAGYYSVFTRVASGEDSTTAQLRHNIEVDGDVVANYTHGTTGDWQNWIDTTAQTVYLSAGRHTVRFLYESQINFNYISFTPVELDSATEIDATVSLAMDSFDVTAATSTFDVTVDSAEGVKALFISVDASDSFVIEGANGFSVIDFLDGTYMLAYDQSGNGVFSGTDTVAATITVDGADGAVVTISDVIIASSETQAYAYVASDSASSESAFAMFYACDLNGDDVVNYSDIACIVPFFGYSDEDTDLFDAKYDLTNDGAIGSDDYLTIYRYFTA